MNLAERLASLFEQLQGQECCDQCVVERITIQGANDYYLSDIRDSAWVLAESSGFHRAMGKCSFCKLVKTVTRVC